MNPMTLKERQEFYIKRNNDVVVDFDGTLCRWSYPDMGPPTVGARKAMKWLRGQGMRVIINTCRMSPEFNTETERLHTMMRLEEWMHKYNIPYDDIDDGNNGKRLGAVFIDDQAVSFGGDWTLACQQTMVRRDMKRKRGEVHSEEVLHRD